MVIELMGNKAGWLTLYAGVAGGADIILLPEIPYDIEKVCQAVEKRRKQGKAFSIITIAEGALSPEEAALPKKELKAALEARTVPVSYRVAAEVQKATGAETRVVVPGHIQRGGSPRPMTACSPRSSARSRPSSSRTSSTARRWRSWATTSWRTSLRTSQARPSSCRRTTSS